MSGEGGGGVGLVSSEGGAGVTTTHRSTFQGAPLQCSNPLSQTAHNQQLRLTAIPQGNSSVWGVAYKYTHMIPHVRTCMTANTFMLYMYMHVLNGKHTSLVT